MTIKQISKFNNETRMVVKSGIGAKVCVKKTDLVEIISWKDRISI